MSGRQYTKPTKGFLIIVDGPDGVGKSTFVQALGAALAARHQEGTDGVVQTREPGGTKFAERIRNLILDPDPAETVSPITDALLFTAARAQHYAQTVIPALEEDKFVISDRGLLSTLAYQGGRQGGVPRIQLESWSVTAMQGRLPDLQILMTASHTAIAERTWQRNQNKDRMELSTNTKEIAARFVTMTTKEWYRGLRWAQVPRVHFDVTNATPDYRHEIQKLIWMIASRTDSITKIPV